jgi:hypothetical protein
MRKSKKRANVAKGRKKRAASEVATGAKLAAVAGRPSKPAVISVFGKAGYALSWLARAERLEITPERLCAKFKADPQAVKADWAALTAKKA